MGAAYVRFRRRASLGKSSDCDPSASRTRGFFLDPAQFNPYGLLAFATGLDIGLNYTLFIDNFLEVVQEEVVIRV